MSAVFVPEERVERTGRALTPIAEQTESGALMAFIARAATDSSIDISKLERLLEMQQRLTEKRAEAAFNNAMAEFKAVPVDIAKNKHVRFQTSKGVTEYDHATLDEVCRSINPSLSTNGLSYRWLTEQLDGGRIKVTCIVSHRDGHTERTSLSSSPDDTGGKNNIQSIGSAVSYLQRYTLLAALGVATGEADDDGTSAGPHPETINERQVADLVAVLSEVGASKESLLKYLKADSLESIPAANYDTVVKIARSYRKPA